MRTFIELELPPGVKETIQQRQDSIRSSLAAHGAESYFRWTSVANIHLTLRFLGETSDRQQQLLARGLEAVAREWRPISLCVSQLGGFPTIQRPRVLWLGIDGDGDDLDALRGIQRKVERLAQGVGFEGESRPYSPHLTIARIKRDCSRSDAQQAGAILRQLSADGSRGYDNSDYKAILVLERPLRRSISIRSPRRSYRLPS